MRARRPSSGTASRPDGLLEYSLRFTHLLFPVFINRCDVAEHAQPLAVTLYKNVGRPFVGVELLTAEVGGILDSYCHHGRVAIYLDARITRHFKRAVRQRAGFDK